MLEVDLMLMSLVIFLPAFFGAACLLFPSSRPEAVRWWATLGGVLSLTLGLCLLVDGWFMMNMHVDSSGIPMRGEGASLETRAERVQSGEAQPLPLSRRSFDMVARQSWIEPLNVEYAIGIDGISLALVLLTDVVMLLSILASWNIDKHVRGYFAMLGLLHSGVLGAFLSLDLFLFYVFYELMLIPMYFLIGIWGGPRRRYCALKFVIYTLFGSVAILTALAMMYFTDVRDFVDPALVRAKANDIRLEAQRQGRPVTHAEAMERVTIHSFDMGTMYRAGRAALLLNTGQAERIAAKGDPTLDGYRVELLGRGVRMNDPGVRKRLEQPFFRESWQFALFGLLFLGFAVKVPIVPLHGWLPDAHVEAPTPVSMILAGLLLKLGGYGILRIALPICPFAAMELSGWVAGIGVFAILYGAFAAMAQSDFKRLLAYSSISHMGFVILGIAVWSGASKSQYWAWGLNGAMFQMIAHGITATALFFVVGVVYDRAHHREISRFGGLMEPMPMYGGLSAVLVFASMGLPGLCGFVGEFTVMMAAWHYHPSFALAAIASTVLTAGYLLWMWQRVYLGTNPATAEYPDLSLREALVLLPSAGLAITLGVWPNAVMSFMEPSTTMLAESLARLRP